MVERGRCQHVSHTSSFFIYTLVIMVHNISPHKRVLGGGALVRGWWVSLLQWTHSPHYCYLPLNFICKLDIKGLEGDSYVLTTF